MTEEGYCKGTAGGISFFCFIGKFLFYIIKKRLQNVSGYEKWKYEQNRNIWDSYAFT